MMQDNYDFAVQEEAVEFLKSSHDLDCLLLLCKVFPFDEALHEPYRTLKSRSQWIHGHQSRSDETGKTAKKLLQFATVHSEPSWPIWDSNTPIGEAGEHIRRNFHSVYERIRPSDWIRAGLDYDRSLLSRLQEHGHQIKQWLESFDTDAKQKIAKVGSGPLD